MWHAGLLVIASIIPIIKSVTEKCIQKEDFHGNICVCDPLDSSHGWLYTCFNANFEVLYTIEYVEDHSVSFQCDEQEPNYQSFLKNMNLSNIRTFSFKSCPQPKSSYSEIFSQSNATQIEQLKIQGKHDNLPFSPTTFHSLSFKLKSVILTSNNLNELSESLFDNFTELQYLSLSDNKLKALPPSIFDDLSRLVALEISNNNLERLEENQFQSLVSLEKLYLYKNYLKDLSSNVFASMEKLIILDLADNHLFSLPSDIFNSLKNLMHLRLRGNSLKTLPENLFRYTSSLGNLDLSFNEFNESLPSTLLGNLIRVENISFHGCNLSTVPPMFFQHCPNLTRLDLSRNKLVILSEELFENNIMLNQLEINFNLINDLPKNMFQNHKLLQKLSFFRNNISVIPVDFFKRTSNLKVLLIGQNRIKSVDKEIFRNLPNLEILDISENNLTHFSLDLNEKIKQLDLSHNSFNEMPLINWVQHVNLEKIDLEYNNIRFFSIPLLYSTNKISPVVNLAHNQIRTVNVDNIVLNDEIISEINHLKDFDNHIETRVILDSNPFDCDCKLFQFYHYATKNYQLPKRSVRFDGARNWTCKYPPRLSGQQVVSVAPTDFICDIQNECPSVCSCYVRSLDDVTVVNCSDRNLHFLPNIIPQSTSILDIRRNSINDMSAFNDDKWQNLTELLLDDNKITHLDHWNIPSTLKNLSLQRNHIQHLDSPILHYLTNVELSLSGNPWECNCSTIDFKKWLAEHYLVVHDVKDINCFNKSEFNSTTNSSILTLSDDILCPVTEWPYRLHLIIVTVVCVILALLLFVVSVLYYRNKQTVIAYVYIHMHTVFTCFFNEDDMDEDKMFDAFISYSNADRDVALSILEELEPRFRLCIHERNWIAGHPISWSIVNSVQSSRRTIIVLSNEFLRSMWFQVEFRAAYCQMLEDGVGRLVVVVRGDLPPRAALDSDLQQLLTTNSYLVWGEKWFWEKLKYSLPHKKQVPKDVLSLKEKPASEKIKSVENQIAVLSSNQSFTNEAFAQMDAIDKPKV